MIESVTGWKPRAFRAPHGYRSPFLISIIVDMSYTVFGWTFGVFDTARPGVRRNPPPCTQSAAARSDCLAARRRRLRPARRSHADSARASRDY
jgi:hypothetical protein